MTKSHIITTKTKGEVDMSSVYLSELTEGFIKPEKEEYHDEILDKEMREVE